MRAAHLATTEEAGGIDIDGPRLVWADVATAPTELLRPWTLHGEFHHDDGCFELNPVMWHTLAAHGWPARGPDPAEMQIFDNPADVPQQTIWSAQSSSVTLVLERFFP